MNVVNISGGDGETLNALWVIDRNPNQVEDCRVSTTSRRGYCWIEAEYKAFGFGPLSGQTWWVWADVRPNYPGYYEHDLMQVSSADYGNGAYLGIVQQTNPTTTWYVQISSTTFFGSEDSTSNTMYADAIRIGLELSGTSGWYAPVEHFTYNFWVDSARNFNYQSVSGNKDQQAYPAYGNWASYPNGDVNAGGDWYTCVQTAGC